jgi:hypothetical protein
MSAPGSRSTDASVNTFMISLVRWLVLAKSTSNDPTIESRVSRDA